MVSAQPKMTGSQLNGSETLITLGGPLFRKPGTSHAEFSLAWHRHAQVVVPWFLEFGVVEYIQIHLPGPEREGEAATHSGSAAERVLRRADGVALVRGKSVPSVEGGIRPFGDGLTHPYLETVVAPDERRFLHEESGIGAIKRTQPTIEVPNLDVEEWQKTALQMGGIEYVKIKDAKDLIEGSWWDEWERLELGIPN